MKKTFTLLAGVMLTSVIAFGQAQRLVLTEEFTGETCGPCAANNPGYNAILNANASKIVSIKYQNNIPSNGPNFYAYNTSDIANRTTFYANNYSPHAFLDGNVWDGNAGAFTTALVNNRYSVSSPFEVEVSHSFSPSHDIIYVHSVVRAVQAVSTANPKSLRLAITEKNIYGYTSPNGESDYEHVMRKMLPNGTGTTLPTTWAVGDSVVTDVQWTITPGTLPNIYTPFWPMLEVVAFVQDNTTKEVMQVGKSFADPALIVDAAITNTTVPSVLCAPSFTPSITLKNYEGYTVTSMDIEFGISGQTLTTYNWTGSLAAGATASVTLPSVTASGTGVLTFVANITSINGSADPVNPNNNKTINIGVPSSVGVTSIVQAFALATFPPPNWIIENPDNASTWTRSTAGLNGAGSAKMDFYNSTAGNIDIMDVLEPLDLTNATSATFAFDVAHRQYSAAETDNLKLEVSGDCGTTWTSLFNKSGATLATVTGYQTTGFTPTAAQWRNENVSLSNYLGQSNLLFRFKATSDYGNNAYVDNVNVTVVTGVNEILNESTVNIYPGLVTDKVNVSVNLKDAHDVVITVNDIVGKLVKEVKAVSVKQGFYVVDMKDLAKGTYVVTFGTETGAFTKKVTKN